MRLKGKMLAACVTAMLAIGAAYGETAATSPANKASKAAPASGAPIGERTDKAIDCSKKADALKLHGNARKQFMTTCKKG